MKNMKKRKKKERIEERKRTKGTNIQFKKKVSKKRMN